MPEPCDIDHHRRGRCSTDAVIAELAGLQHGVVGRWQLIGRVSAGAIDRRLAAGRLHPVWRGVYAVGHLALTTRSRLMAAVLAGGPAGVVSGDAAAPPTRFDSPAAGVSGDAAAPPTRFDSPVAGVSEASASTAVPAGRPAAVVSGASAAALWELRRRFPSTIEVTSPRGARPLRGLRRRRIVLPADEMTVRHGIPVTTVARTLLDRAAQLDVHALARELEQADVLRLVDAVPLGVLLERYPKSPGRAKLMAIRAADLAGSAASKSDLEDLFLALVTRAAGLTARLPIASRSVPFDVDLGPDAEGRTVAVYSRCEGEPPPGTGGPAQYHRGRGCDLYVFDFAEGRERTIPAASSPTASEYWPSIWRGEIAFGRTYESKRDHPYLYVKDLRSRRSSRRQPGGQRKECFRDRRTRRLVCSDERRSAPLALELYGRRLAFAWSYQGLAEGRDFELRMDTVIGPDTRPRRAATAGGGGLTATTVGWPAFEAGRLYSAHSCFGDLQGCPRRFRLERLAYGASNAQADAARPPETNVFSHERDGGTTYVLVDREGQTECRGDPMVPGGTCELLALRPRYE